MKRAFVLLSLLLACDPEAAPSSEAGSTATVVSSGSASPMGSAAASSKPDAPKSPLHVVLNSNGAVSMAGVVDGVWISEGPGKRVAQAKAGADLVASATAEGLPDAWGEILNVSGTLANLWVSLALEKPADGSMAKTPLFRFDGTKFRQIDENWRALVAVWSNNRELALWQSQGRLTTKVPLGASKTPDDRPGADLDDSRCPFNLRLGSLAALPSGEVFLLGSCSTTGAKSSRSVVIQWPLEEEAPKDVDPLADMGEPEAEGTRGHVMVLPGLERKLSTSWMVARSAKNVLVAGVDDEAEPKKSYLWRYDGAAWNAIELPNAEVVRGVAETAAGVLWLTTENGVWTKDGAAKWQAVVLPEGKWTFANVAAVDDTVWIAAKRDDKGAVLSTKPATTPLTW